MSSLQGGKVYYCKSSCTNNINTFPSNTKLYVDEKATFTPSSMSNAAGEVINYGTANFTNISIGKGFTVSNYSTLNFINDLNTNGNNFKLINYISGSVTFRRNLNSSNNTEITNYGMMQFEQDFNMNGKTLVHNADGGYMTFSRNMKLQNSSEFTNAGDLVLLAELTTDQNTKLVNSGFLETYNGKNMNLNGVVDNNGFMVSSGFINMNSSMQLTNMCTFIAQKGFNNNGKIVNYGLVLVEPNTQTSGSALKVQNNSGGQIIMADAFALVQGQDFTNNGTVAGEGKLYFTGNTVNQGSFGNTSGDKLSFYDASNRNGNGFDTDNRKATISSKSVSSYTVEEYVAACATCSEPVRERMAPINPLPVELMEFKVKKDNKSRAVLTWKTATEENNDRFEVERSTDGKVWSKIGEVAGAGNSKTVLSYSYSDMGFVSSSVPFIYYRLKQVDTDGKFEYSKVVALEQDQNKAVAKIDLIYYNPSNAAVEVKYSNVNSNYLELVVVNIDGKVIYNNKVALNGSYGVVSVPVAEAAKGMYVAKAATGNIYQSAKFVK